MNLPKYPKFKDADNCAYPKRDNCNYDDNTPRCEYMKFNGAKGILDPTRWECTYKK